MGRTLNILVVDDHADTLLMLARLVARLGHQVTSAESCKAARAAADAAGWQFDMLLCDVGLPDGDGAELMAEFKRRCGCVTIALTGFGLDGDLARYSAHQVDQCLVKPVDFALLKSVLAGEPA
ncbi:MAG: response regulator [Phycisphaerae bacterium]|nr:response regulator [Tepidisphaeraceae bacterium]